MKIISEEAKIKIKNRHHSIKTQMIMAFVGLLICLVVTLMFTNGKFLEPYYISKKESRFIELYEKLNDVSNENKWNSTKKNGSLIHFAEKNNISYLVIGKDNDVHTNVHDKNMLKNQMMGYFLNQAQKESKILDFTEVYQINQSWDPWNQNYYVDMWGSLDDGSQFLLRSPVESMRESAAISNRFLLYIGSILIVISIFLIWYFAKRITEPICELARLSDRMADLDFDAKYTSGGSNEIGELGENFNRMSEKLESTISELKKANNSLQKDIEQKDKLEKMRNEFLGNVSHELKTPITSMKVLADSLIQNESADLAMYKEFMTDIVDEIDRESKIITDLLTLVKMDKKSAAMNIEEIKINDLLEVILKRVTPIAKSRGIQITYESYRDVTAWVDEVKLSLALTNIIENAVKYNVDNGWVKVTLNADHRNFYVKVADSGVGIPDDCKEHVFERFYRVDKARSRDTGGTGLGLAITKSVIQMHKGSIKLYSESGEGTTFTIRIPMKSDASVVTTRKEGDAE